MAAAKKLVQHLAILIGALVLLPLVAAQDNLEYYPVPRTANANEIKGLFDIVLWIAMFVFVFVEGLLIYILWRFRHNKTVPKGETHRGNTQAEIFWTLVPALVFILIGVLSVQTLEKLDKVPADSDVLINVQAERFAWRFFYLNCPSGLGSDAARAACTPDHSATPDGKDVTINTLYLEAGHKVRFDVTSTDVIHAFAVPALAIHIDAVPGRTNAVWAPIDQAGDFFMQCELYCGVGHHGMRANVVVYEAGKNGGKAWGPPPGTPGFGPAGPPPGFHVDANVTATLVEKPVAKPSDTWGIDPAKLTVKKGQGVHLIATNGGKAVHSFVIPDFKVDTHEIAPGTDASPSSKDAYFVADKEGTFEYYCGVPGHKSLGMVGTLTVTA